MLLVTRHKRVGAHLCLQGWNNLPVLGCTPSRRARLRQPLTSRSAMWTPTASSTTWMPKAERWTGDVDPEAAPTTHEAVRLLYRVNHCPASAPARGQRPLAPR